MVRHASGGRVPFFLAEFFLFRIGIGFPGEIRVCVHHGVVVVHVRFCGVARISSVGKRRVSKREITVYFGVFWVHCGDVGSHVVVEELCLDCRVQWGADFGFGMVLCHICTRRKAWDEINLGHG